MLVLSYALLEKNMKVCTQKFLSILSLKMAEESSQYRGHRGNHSGKAEVVAVPMPVNQRSLREARSQDRGYRSNRVIKTVRVKNHLPVLLTGLENDIDISGVLVLLNSIKCKTTFYYLIK